ncbi:hypothetical protein BLNAU_15712 [Blattamonas nauphoetae]|uniref:Uncharacterized protein n=1 Tax=Blattamonas nauphoetae TaxID=2049346 RepID=A0ABQ9XFE3_9EUKA|nr:hypothetical protein BLNAU_15712 [Blattamonas nauphoetae]
MRFILLLSIVVVIAIILFFCCGKKKTSGEVSSNKKTDDSPTLKKDNPSEPTAKQAPATSTLASQSRTPSRSLPSQQQETTTTTDVSKTKQSAEVDEPDVEETAPQQRQVVIDHDSDRLTEEKSKTSSQYEADKEYSFDPTLLKGAQRPQLSDDIDLDDEPEMRKEQSRATQDAEVEELF